MKPLKLYFLFGIILFFSSSFAQSFQSGDLIGAWQYGTGPGDLKIIFRKDSILLWEEGKYNYKDSLIYSMDSTMAGNILSTQSKHRPGSNHKTLYKVRIINKDQITLYSYKNMSYDSSTKTWVQDTGGDQMFVIIELKRLNQ